MEATKKLIRKVEFINYGRKCQMSYCDKFVEQGERLCPRCEKIWYDAELERQAEMEETL
jgi:hypothetical protein